LMILVFPVDDLLALEQFLLFSEARSPAQVLTLSEFCLFDQLLNSLARRSREVSILPLACSKLGSNPSLTLVYLILKVLNVLS